jgi:hypothetical protein
MRLYTYTYYRERCLWADAILGEKRAHKGCGGLKEGEYGMMWKEKDSEARVFCRYFRGWVKFVISARPSLLRLYVFRSGLGSSIRKGLE